MHISVKKIFILGLSSAVLSLSAFAADETTGGTSQGRILPHARPIEDRSELKPSVGLLAGYSTLNGSNFSNNAAGILEVGVQPYVPFGVAAQFQYSPGNLDVPGAQVDFNTTNILAKFTYNFGGDIPVLRNAYIGGKTGTTIYSGDVDTKFHYSLGPVIGFDIPVDRMKTLSLGAEGTYLGVMGDNSPDQISALGAVKYWF